ncbi:MAG: MBL fold metallo-hydrolase [Opitutae bacterium]|nr:MBL fold metallo-hydrolase [Opitutae bacterium]
MNAFLHGLRLALSDAGAKGFGMKKLEVRKMELGPIGTNAYLLWEEGGGEAVLVDAPPSCNHEIEPFLERHELTLKEIWLTHGHWDHMAGASELVRDGVAVLGHKADKMLFEQPSVMATFAIPGMDFLPVEITRWIEEGEELDLFGRSVSIFHCPGHCPGNVAFWVESEAMCLVGDVIFAGSVGRADLPGGDFSLLERSIREKIYVLPNETVLMPGHGPDTTVMIERESNPFVRP